MKNRISVGVKVEPPDQDLSLSAMELPFLPNFPPSSSLAWLTTVVRGLADSVSLPVTLYAFNFLSLDRSLHPVMAPECFGSQLWAFGNSKKWWSSNARGPVLLLSLVYCMHCNSRWMCWPSLVTWCSCMGCQEQGLSLVLKPGASLSSTKMLSFVSQDYRCPRKTEPHWVCVHYMLINKRSPGLQCQRARIGKCETQPGLPLSLSKLLCLVYSGLGVCTAPSTMEPQPVGSILMQREITGLSPALNII